MLPERPGEGKVSPPRELAYAPRMPTANLCALDALGQVIVISDGRELLVHRGSDDAPMWRRDLGADLVGLGTSTEHVLSLEADGHLRWWAFADGAVIGDCALGGNAAALAVARKASLAAVLLGGEVALVERAKEPRMIGFPGASAVAVADDGSKVAIGGESGEIRIVGAGGEPAGEGKLEGAVSSLCWSPAGFWIATSGDRVLRVAPAGGAPEHITRAEGLVIDCAAASSDGRMFAVRLGDDLALALSYPGRETVVQLRYLDRKVSGVSFGAGPILGVGLVGGDGNIIEIMSEGVRRTDTFEGRTHNRWMLSAVVKPAALGAAPPPARAPAPAADAPAPGMLKWLAIAAVVGVVAVVLSQC